MSGQYARYYRRLYLRTGHTSIELFDEFHYKMLHPTKGVPLDEAYKIVGFWNYVAGGDYEFAVVEPGGVWDWASAENAPVPSLYLTRDGENFATFPLTEADTKRVLALVERLNHYTRPPAVKEQPSRIRPPHPLDLVVFKSDSEEGFWSNDTGWSYDIEDATRYIREDAEGQPKPQTFNSDAEIVTVLFYSE